MASFRSNLIHNQNQGKINTIPAVQDTFKFDLQSLLERETLNETWNKLMRNGLLVDLISHSTVSNKSYGSPIGMFPCACCEGECDTKCPTLIPNSTDPVHSEAVAKVIHSWAWNKDPSEFAFLSFASVSFLTVKNYL